jgi:thioredoxin reductase
MVEVFFIINKDSKLIISRLLLKRKIYDHFKIIQNNNFTGINGIVFACNMNEFENKKVIVKGCGQVPLKEALYIAITKKLQNTVSSLMFGEACSAVPVFKKK